MEEKSGLCTAALVLAIVSIFFNPLYIITIIALILSIIAIVKKPRPTNRGQAIAALIIIPIALGIQVVLDICSLMIGGVGFFC